MVVHGCQAAAETCHLIRDGIRADNRKARKIHATETLMALAIVANAISPQELSCSWKVTISILDGDRVHLYDQDVGRLVLARLCHLF